MRCVQVEWEMMEMRGNGEFENSNLGLCEYTENSATNRNINKRWLSMYEF